MSKYGQEGDKEEEEQGKKHSEAQHKEKSKVNTGAFAEEKTF